MNISFYNGVSGLIAFQQDMDTLSHNMANINTNGFKASRSSFEDLLYTEMAVNSAENPMVGHGARVAGKQLLFGQGNLQPTSSMLDFAIVGEGMFAVERGEQVQYTRNGSFALSVEGKKAYLVSKDGGYILDGKGKRIEVKKKEDGAYDFAALKDTVGVYQFSNPYGLQQTNASSFIATDTSGEAWVPKSTEDKPYELRQASLELSNVQLTDEMVNLIVTQKGYQMNAKMVQAADQIQEIVNNLR